MFKKNTIKVVVLMLTFSMMLSLMQGALDNTDTKADMGDASAVPSISAFADKAALAGSTFNPTSAARENIAKIKFGKGDAAWYILGGDSGVSEPNMAIFATSNFIDSQQFLDEGNYSYDPTYSVSKYTGKFNPPSDGSYEGGTPSIILANHYGVSELKDKLDDMSSIYFSASEQALMNTTRINTVDYYNNKIYSTNDRLYAASASDTYIYVGSDNSKQLRADYWSSGSSFWLRSPLETDSENALFAAPSEKTIGNTEVRKQSGIRPAANINLTNVLFASAARAAVSQEVIKGEIAKEAAMSLRLGGSKKSIGSVTYSTNTINVTVATNSSAALVVQGRDAQQNKDWYYSKLITGTWSTTEEDILAVLNNSQAGSLNISNVNLDNCKIWLEVSADSDSTLAYAVEAEKIEVHEHSYDGSWTADRANHWKQCTPADACPKLEESIKEKAAHEYGADEHKASWKYNSDKHYKLCEICESDNSMIDEAAHEFGADGKCIICGYSINEKHKLKEVEAKSPTCTEKGNKKYWYCTDDRCEVKYRLGDKETFGVQVLEEFTDMSDVEISALGHLESTEYKHDEKEHWHICTREGCGVKLSIAEHTFNDKNVCTACGYAKPDEGDDGDKDKGDEDKGDQDKGDEDKGDKDKGDEDKGDEDKGDKDKGDEDKGDEDKGDQDKGDEDKGDEDKDDGDKDSDDKKDDGSSIVTRTKEASNINTGWVKNSKGWRFRNSDGTYAKGELITDADGKTKTKLLWERIGSSYYAFGADAYLVTGWIYDDISSKWYYCDENAGMLHGWFYDTKYGSWYYLDTRTGSMYADTITPDNYKVDKSGVLIREN